MWFEIFGLGLCFTATALCLRERGCCSCCSLSGREAYTVLGELWLQA